MQQRLLRLLMMRNSQRGSDMSEEALTMAGILVLYGLFWLITGLAAGRILWGL